MDNDEARKAAEKYASTNYGGQHYACTKDLVAEKAFLAGAEWLLGMAEQNYVVTERTISEASEDGLVTYSKTYLYRYIGLSELKALVHGQPPVPPCEAGSPGDKEE